MRNSNRKFDKGLKSLTHAPYYVSEMSPKIHHTREVLLLTHPHAFCPWLTISRFRAFYAAGECTGGIHGAVRIGANAVIGLLSERQSGGRNRNERRQEVKRVISRLVRRIIKISVYLSTSFLLQSAAVSRPLVYPEPS